MSGTRPGRICLPRQPAMACLALQWMFSGFTPGLSSQSPEESELLGSVSVAIAPSTRILGLEWVQDNPLHYSGLEGWAGAHQKWENTPPHHCRSVPWTITCDRERVHDRALHTNMCSSDNTQTYHSRPPPRSFLFSSTPHTPSPRREGLWLLLPLLLGPLCPFAWPEHLLLSAEELHKAWLHWLRLGFSQSLVDLA